MAIASISSPTSALKSTDLTRAVSVKAAVRLVAFARGNTAAVREPGPLRVFLDIRSELDILFSVDS